MTLITRTERPSDHPLDSHQPLRSREDLDQRVRQLVPCAVQRQLWLLLLDDDDIQMPVMIPVGDLPLRCRAADGEGIDELLAGLKEEFHAASFVFILERPGPASPRLSDRHWLRHLLRAGAGRDFTVRGVYLCHDDGIAGYEVDDLDAVDEASASGRAAAEDAREPNGAPSAAPSDDMAAADDSLIEDDSAVPVDIEPRSVSGRDEVVPPRAC